jgi:septal ring factor EnvC (AmiA/AmiB activator)
LRQLDETKRQLTIAVDNSAKQQDQIVQLEERLREAHQDLDVLGPRVTVLEHEVRAGVARENALARTITDLESSVNALQRCGTVAACECGVVRWLALNSLRTHTQTLSMLPSPGDLPVR